MSAIKAGRAWLFSHHSPAQIASHYSSVRAEDFLIAVDGGLEQIRALGREPDLLIGDLDSWEQALPDCRIERFKPEKAETDTELALLWALGQGYREIVICNDMKGRIDHALGLLQNLELCSADDNSIRIETENQIICMLKSENKFCYPKGTLLSLIARSPVVRLKSSTGLYYPLDGLSLYPQYSRGISNYFTAEEAEIHLVEGQLLAIISLFN